MNLNEKTTLQEVLEELPAALNGATAKSLRRLSLLQEAKERGLSREMTRARTIEGEDSAYVLGLDLGRAVRAQMATMFRRAATLTDLRQSIRDKGSSVVHGRVLGKDGNGVKGVFVRAINDAESSMAESRTDNAGYFAMELEDLPAAESASLLGRARLRKTKSGPASEDSFPSAADTFRVRLVVLDELKRVKYRDSDPRIIGREEVMQVDIVMTV